VIQHHAVRVNGYQRDRAGRWRYETTSKYVPGARDITIASKWRFPKKGNNVLVPIAALIAPELAWCRPYIASSAVRTSGRITAIEIPLDDWKEQATRVIGMDAPELAAHLMVDIQRLATMLQTTPSTIRAYETRGQIPHRTIEGFNSPLWSVPIIVQWIERRLSNAPKVPKTTQRTPTKHKSPTEPLDLVEIDAMLERITTSLYAQDLTDTPNENDDQEADDETEVFSDRYQDR
jgi:hypothetical protein